MSTRSSCSPSNFWINEKGDKFLQPKNHLTADNVSYLYSTDWSNGLAVLNINNKFGFYNHTGKAVIQPTYDYADSYSESLALVGKKNEFNEMKYGFINTKGQVVIPLMYTNKPGRFSCGLAHVEPTSNKDFFFAYINRDNQVVLKFNEGNLPKGIGYAGYAKDGFVFDNYGLAKIDRDYYLDTLGNFYTKQQADVKKQPLKKLFPDINEADKLSKISLLFIPNGGASTYQYLNKDGKVILQTKPKGDF